MWTVPLRCMWRGYKGNIARDTKRSGQSVFRYGDVKVVDTRRMPLSKEARMVVSLAKAYRRPATTRISSRRRTRKRFRSCSQTKQSQTRRWSRALIKSHLTAVIAVLNNSACLALRDLRPAFLQQFVDETFTTRGRISTTLRFWTIRYSGYAIVSSDNSVEHWIYEEICIYLYSAGAVFATIAPNGFNATIKSCQESLIRTELSILENQITSRQV
jgi:hypothetical protein